MQAGETALRSNLMQTDNTLIGHGTFPGQGRPPQLALAPAGT